MIVCKSPSEIERMRAANLLVADVLAELAGMVAPGVTTADLDAKAEKLIREAGAEPAFKGYRGYPCTLCASVNEQVVHGIPSDRALVMRVDDGQEIVRERLKVYQRQTKPLVDYYSQRPTFRAINGNRPPDDVTAQVESAVMAAIGGAAL